MQSKENLGPFIKRLREQRGVSLAEIQDKTGLSASYINRLENKTRQNPTLDSISRLVKYFEIPFSSMEEFCDCGNSLEGEVKNLDFILLNQSYMFANLEADLDFKMILRDLIKELENYSTKASISRQDEAKIIDIAVKVREKLLTA
ncbi:helix-turn-helix domain-containing protein [Clostridium estertheticum]|uniref:helix-turn-helix domain-containing protein n=1 Tax=Clostridium estertheticum TaxID=238834 RepID=UPI0013E941DC|nr:helix-turn-helix transcriptional regulator [Clostridium estertheticum]MBZ9689386.1 helix-turn-helix domain-containing protein [Clostridium estertheticum]